MKKDIIIILLVSLAAFSCSTQKKPFSRGQIDYTPVVFEPFSIDTDTCTAPKINGCFVIDTTRVHGSFVFSGSENKWEIVPQYDNLPFDTIDTALQHEVLKGSTVLWNERYTLKGGHFWAKDTVILSGNVIIRVGNATYNLKELIEAKKKNEVLEEMLLKMVKSDQQPAIIGWDISHDPITGCAIYKVSPVLLKGESIWSNSKTVPFIK